MSSSVMCDSAKLLDFLELVGRLKHEKRTGWVIRNVQECESIAGHMYRMGIITFLMDATTAHLDRLRCLQIALIHDLAECIVGDITPHCGVSVEDKHKMEDEAMKELQQLAGAQGDLMYDLYKEYENQSSAEAKFVKELDRFDMILQAYEYEKRDKNPRHLEEFFTATKGKFTTPLIVNLVEELDKRRAKLLDTQKLLNGDCVTNDD